MYHTYRRRFALHYFVQINDKSEPIPYRKKVRIILIWWRRGESNPRPKTLPWELLRAQTVIAEVLLLPFPSPQASRHA